MSNDTNLCERCGGTTGGMAIEYKGTKICSHCATWTSWGVRPGACNFFDKANLSDIKKEEVIHEN
jgi:hypothetical protein